MQIKIKKKVYELFIENHDCAEVSERNMYGDITVCFWGQQARRSPRPAEVAACGSQADEWDSNGSGWGYMLWELQVPERGAGQQQGGGGGVSDSTVQIAEDGAEEGCSYSHILWSDRHFLTLCS